MTKSLFKDQTKAAWLDKVMKDLRGADYDTIQCDIEPGLILDPLYTAEELTGFPPIFWPSQSESWKIVESFELNSETESNALNTELLECLAGGCQVLEIEVDEKTDFNPQELFANVLLELVTIRISIDKKSKSKIHEFIQHYANNKQVRVDEIDLEFTDEKQIVKMASSNFHSNDLAEVLTHLQKSFEFRSSSNWNNVVIDIPIGNELLTTISKLRALKLLLYALADEMGIPFNSYPTLSARIETEVVTEELESIIERGTKALSAALGGVDEIHIAWDFYTDMKLSNKDKRRVSRNINWLLKSECELGQIGDPLNGSYWIEQCTQKLVERAWSKYKAGGEC